MTNQDANTDKPKVVTTKYCCPQISSSNTGNQQMTPQIIDGGGFYPPNNPSILNPNIPQNGITIPQNGMAYSQQGDGMPPNINIDIALPSIILNNGESGNSNTVEETPVVNNNESVLNNLISKIGMGSAVTEEILREISYSLDVISRKDMPESFYNDIHAIAGRVTPNNSPQENQFNLEKMQAILHEELAIKTAEENENWNELFDILIELKNGVNQNTVSIVNAINSKEIYSDTALRADIAEQTNQIQRLIELNRAYFSDMTVEESLQNILMLLEQIKDKEISVYTTKEQPNIVYVKSQNSISDKKIEVPFLKNDKCQYACMLQTQNGVY